MARPTSRPAASTRGAGGRRGRPERQHSRRLPAAPKLRSKALLSDVMAKAPDTVAASVPARAVSALLQGWTAAHDSARARLESGMRVARLNQLFAPSGSARAAA